MKEISEQTQTSIKHQLLRSLEIILNLCEIGSVDAKPNPVQMKRKACDDIKRYIVNVEAGQDFKRFDNIGNTVSIFRFKVLHNTTNPISSDWMIAIESNCNMKVTEMQHFQNAKDDTTRDAHFSFVKIDETLPSANEQAVQ